MDWRRSATKINQGGVTHKQLRLKVVQQDCIVTDIHSSLLAKELGGS